MLQRLLLACSLLSLAVACGKPASAGETRPAPVAADDATCQPDPLVAVRDAACACADEACATKVGQELEAQQARVADLVEQAQECLARHGGPAEEVLREMQRWQQASCACKDRACLDKVDRDIEAWVDANMARYKDVKPTPAQDERADRIQDAMKVCRERFKP